MEERRHKAYTLAYDTDLEKPKGFFDELFDDEHEYDDPWKKADDDDLEWH